MLPEKTRKFQSYYAPALKTKSLWRLLAGVVVLPLFYIIGTFLIDLLITVTTDIAGNYETLESISRGADPKSVILLLTTFTVMFASILLTVKLVHKRGLKSLLGPDLAAVRRNFIYGAAVIFILILVTLPITVFFNPPVRNLEIYPWLSWMVFGLPLLLLQVTSEELIFRGYLQQQLAARFDSRWIWYVLPSALFGMMHYDPVTMGSNAWLIVAYTMVFGLIAADITTRTGNLGAAIGLHFANNLFALAIISMDGSLSGLGLYKTAFHVSDEVAVRSALVPELIFTLLLYGLFMLWARNRPQL